MTYYVHLQYVFIILLPMHFVWSFGVRCKKEACTEMHEKKRDESNFSSRPICYRTYCKVCSGKNMTLIMQKYGIDNARLLAAQISNEFVLLYHLMWQNSRHYYKEYNYTDCAIVMLIKSTHGCPLFHSNINKTRLKFIAGKFFASLLSYI